MGVLEDHKNKDKLIKLLRYHSTKSEDKLISFEDYVERMQDDQQHIYYISGESLEAVKKSPMLEELKNRDLEVLFFVDPLDEYLTQSVMDFDGHTLQSVTKEGLTFGDSDEEEQKRVEAELKPVTSWFEKTLGKKVHRVKVSNRLNKSPAVVVTSQYGWSAQMEKIMKAQALGDANQAKFQAAKKILEINPAHPVIAELKKLVEENPDDSNLENAAQLIYDAALLSSGFSHDEPLKLVNRIHTVVAKNLGVDVIAETEEEASAVKTGDQVEAEEGVEFHDEL